MGLDVDLKETEVALESASQDFDNAKSEYSSKKKEAEEHKKEYIPSSEATSPSVVTKTTYDKGLQTVLKSPLQQSQAALGEDHQGPSDLCSLGRCLWDPSLQDTHNDMEFLL